MKKQTETDIASKIIVEIFKERENKEVRISEVKQIVRSESGINIKDNVFAGLFNKFSEDKPNKHNKILKLTKCDRGIYKYTKNKVSNKKSSITQNEEIIQNTKNIIDKSVLDIKNEINKTNWGDKDPQLLVKVKSVIDSLENISKSI